MPGHLKYPPALSIELPSAINLDDNRDIHSLLIIWYEIGKNEYLFKKVEWICGLFWLLSC